jgi:ribosomal protein S18 acetylase RimI-like enzyme
VRLFLLNITLAKEDDVGEIMGLIKDCIIDMESRHIYQWNEYYPNLRIIQDDIQRESIYVLKENEAVLGIIVLNEDQPSEYESLNWSTHEGRILVIHRLAVNPRWQKKGFGTRLLDFAEKHAADNGYASIRLDSYSGNPRALRLYEKHKYKRVGQVHFPRRSLPFYCYEKILK